MRKILIRNELVGYTTEVILCNTGKEYDNYISKINTKLGIDIDLTSKDSNGFFFDHEGSGTIVLREIQLETMVHEIVHLVFKLFDTLGIPTRLENDEIFCYTTGFYVREILKGFKLEVTTIKKS